MNRDNGVRLDVAADGLWGSAKEWTFLDIRVFNPYAPANRRTSLSSTYRRHENEKKRAYCQCINEVELSSFTPLVFSLTGGMARETSVFYKRLVSKLSEKWDQYYSTTLGWLRGCPQLFPTKIIHSMHPGSQIYMSLSCPLPQSTSFCLNAAGAPTWNDN